MGGAGDTASRASSGETFNLLGRGGGPESRAPRAVVGGSRGGGHSTADEERLVYEGREGRRHGLGLAWDGMG